MILPRRPGQSLLEFALSLPLLALMLVGLIELGFLLYAHVQVSNAAREGARAASLYRATRYSNIESNRLSNPPSCASGIDGWSLQQAIDYAIVRYELASNGCPNNSGTIVSTSLGNLPPEPADGLDWSATVDPAFSPADSEAMPTAGARATLVFRYPYRPVILFELFPLLTDPVWIEKSVEFEYGQ